MTEQEKAINWLKNTEHLYIDKCQKYFDMAIKALEEISLYKQGGLCLIPTDVFERQCVLLDEYKELGTVEELRVARDKQVVEEFCEWKAEKDMFIQNPHTKRKFSNEPSMKNIYCNTCGKKIKIVRCEDDI